MERKCLVRACSAGDRDGVLKLLDGGADRDGICEEDTGCEGRSFTPMTAACSKGRLEIVKLLVERGSDVNKVDRCKRSPLGEAAGGTPDIVAGLVAAGADVARYGTSALVSACIMGDMASLDILLRAGAPPRSNGTNSPLSFAIDMHRPEAVQKLLRAGAEANGPFESGDTPLTYAVKRGTTAIVETLLWAGADVNKVDENGCTPLGAARGASKEGIVGILLKAGARDITGAFVAREGCSKSVLPATPATFGVSPPPRDRCAVCRELLELAARIEDLQRTAKCTCGRVTVVIIGGDDHGIYTKGV